MPNEIKVNPGPINADKRELVCVVNLYFPNNKDSRLRLTFGEHLPQTYKGIFVSLTNDEEFASQKNEIRQEFIKYIENTVQSEQKHKDQEEKANQLKIIHDKVIIDLIVSVVSDLKQKHMKFNDLLKYTNRWKTYTIIGSNSDGFLVRESKLNGIIVIGNHWSSPANNFQENMILDRKSSAIVIRPAEGRKVTIGWDYYPLDDRIVIRGLESNLREHPIVLKFFDKKAVLDQKAFLKQKLTDAIKKAAEA